MAFIIRGLDPLLFGSLSDQKQAIQNGAPVEFHSVSESQGFLCRVTLDDAN
ncbi:hypothetical protein [Aquidulcibacter sp.]|jgi:hypothetical protein|uniref:hypothetical protein n=1 Tax=Aquidulcibacter sp. TaxID=2052990 RepID=UPI0028A73192|nr:hypothetical protein [Aquidulcibacter sp.]